MNRLLKGALAVGGGAATAEVLRRAILSGSRPRYEPWERQPYHEFPNRVLILGGGFAGYTAAKTLAGWPGTATTSGSCSSPGRTSSPSGPCSRTP